MSNLNGLIQAVGLGTLIVIAARSLRMLGRLEARFEHVENLLTHTVETVGEQGKAIARIEGRLNGAA